MEAPHPTQQAGRSDDRTVSFGSLSELVTWDVGPDDVVPPSLATPSPSPRRGLRAASGSFAESSNGQERITKSASEHSDPSSRERKRSVSGSREGSRLVRWAAALAGGKTAEAPHAAGQHHRTSSAGDAPSEGGGGSSSGGGTGGDPAGRNSAAGVADNGLFASSPLRNRFRSSRRGSKGWSSSSSLAGWGAANGTGNERIGLVTARGSSNTVSGVLGTIFKGPLAMRVIRQLRVAIALAALTIAGLGALLIGCSLYLTVRPWSRATYRRLVCSQLAAPLVDAASLLLPRTRVRVTGDSDMLDGLCPCVIVSNTLPGNAFLGLDWWAILMVVRAVGAHGYTKVLVSERLNRTPVLGWILRVLEFPGLGDCYQTDRDRVKQCLASFARDSIAAGPSGVPYLFLHFPEGDTLNRDSLTSSLEFAQREGRPELMRVLLPHTTALSACLDGLRPAKPVVYDVTLAAAGYSGEVPCGRAPNDWDILRSLITGRAWDGGAGTQCSDPSCPCRPRQAGPRLGRAGSSSGEGSGDMCSEPSCLCRVVGMSSTRSMAFAAGSGAGGGPPASDMVGIGRSVSVGGVSRSDSVDWSEADMDDGAAGGAKDGGDIWGRVYQDIHVRIRRYSLEEVVGNTHWLDDRWAEKERLLAYFSRHQNFPSDGRGFPARRTLDTRGGHFEGAAMAFVRLSAVLLLVPLMSLAAIPLVIFMGCAALTYRLMSALVRAVAIRVLPRRLTTRIWWRPGVDEDEEDELGQGYSGPQSTLTPWWGGPATPLNTPAPGGAGPISYMTSASGHGKHDYRPT